MQVEIESIDQRLMFDGSAELTMRLTLRLPNGAVISVPVQQEDAELLVSIAQGQEPVEEEQVELQPSEESLAEETIAWLEISDESLPPSVKSEMLKSEVPLQLLPSQLIQIVGEITERLQGDHETEQPQVMRMRTTARRTVPKDEMGYPIVARGQDPGDASPMGADEDGVPQL